MTKDLVLSILKENKNQIVSGGRLAGLCGVSRTAIWKAIASLQADGCTIEKRPNAGYVLISENDMLSAATIEELLTTQTLGRNIIILPVTPSTNDYLKKNSSLPNGTLVLADEQTQGKGRLGREFYSPSKQGIYMSFLLKCSISLQLLPYITITAAVAVSNAIKSVCGIQPNVKWVNDIFCNGKKACGILTEASVEAELGTFNHIIVGIGINTSTESFPEDLSKKAASLCSNQASNFTRNELVAEAINQFEQLFDLLNTSEGINKILQEYKSLLFILGKEIEVVQGDRSYSATAVDLDEAGGLIVKTPNGNIHVLNSGEISIKTR